MLKIPKVIVINKQTNDKDVYKLYNDTSYIIVGRIFDAENSFRQYHTFRYFDNSKFNLTKNVSEKVIKYNIQQLINKYNKMNQYKSHDCYYTEEDFISDYFDVLLDTERC